MSGTKWVEPGQGATIGELRDALRDNRREVGEVFQCADLAAAKRNLSFIRDARIAYPDHGIPSRTNLGLTGSCTTPEDVRRIAECR